LSSDTPYPSPLKTNYAQEIKIWLKNYISQSVTVCHVAGLMQRVYTGAMTENAVTGFRKCEVSPFDPHIFLQLDP